MLKHVVDHPLTTRVSSLIHCAVPWWGIGALVAGAASWLPHITSPAYVYLGNDLYPAGGKPDLDDDDCNKFNWFFHQGPFPHQQAVDVYYQRDPGFPINDRHPQPVIAKLQQLVRQHWVLKQAIVNDARRHVPDPDRTIGVHCRGTDKAFEVAPTPLTMVVEKIRFFQKTLGLDRILLATDDDRIIDNLRGLPKLDYFRGHLRGRSGVGVHHEHGSYNQAREAMTEMIAIGMCRHLLVTQSCMSELALLLASHPQSTWDYSGS